MRSHRLALLLLAGLAPAASAQVAWDDMCVGTPGDPAASWFQPELWSTNAVPTALQDVTFGGPCAIDIPTLVRGFGTPGFGGFPNAVMRSLVANSALTPNPELSTLSIVFGDEPPGQITPGTFTVGQGAFTLGDRYPSTATLSLNQWSFTHQSTSVHTQIATNGASAGLDVTSAPADISFTLRIGRGMDVATSTPSNGTMNVTPGPFPAGLTVDGQTQIGTLGGIGTLNLGDATNNTLTGTVFVGAGTTTTPNGVFAGNGSLSIFDSFEPSNSTTIFGAEILVGTLSGLGLAELYGDIQVGTDAFGTSFIVGRGVTYDTAASSDVRGSGSMGVGGYESNGFVTSGRGFVAIDGATGSFGVGYGGCTINGDLVVADLGATTPNGYTPSDGSVGLGLNAFLAVNGNVFIGNNSSIGVVRLDPSGDGGAGFSANYVGVGNQGTGAFIVGGATSATITTLELLPPTGPQDYRLGGRAELGNNDQGCSLSLEFLNANGNGNRFDWMAGNLTLRDGRIFNWGNHPFVIPSTGSFFGSGEIETDTINNSQLDVGYDTFGAGPYTDSLVIGASPNRPGDFTQTQFGKIYLNGSYPTRLLDGNGEETLIIEGNASLDGELFFYSDASDYWQSGVLPGDTFNLLDFGGAVTGQFIGLPPSPSLSESFYLPNLPGINPAYASYTWDTTQLYTLGIIRVAGGTTGPVCDSIDFNNDTSFFDPTDIDAFLSVFSEGPCIPETQTCNDIDFNNDGSLFDPCDIDAFLLVFSEGPCTLCGL